MQTTAKQSPRPQLLWLLILVVAICAFVLPRYLFRDQPNNLSPEYRRSLIYNARRDELDPVGEIPFPPLPLSFAQVTQANFIDTPPPYRVYGTPVPAAQPPYPIEGTVIWRSIFGLECARAYFYPSADTHNAIGRDTYLPANAILAWGGFLLTEGALLALLIRRTRQT